MAQIPTPEVQDSDFGAFIAAEVTRYSDGATDRWTPFSRVQHADACSRYVQADSMGRVRLQVCTGIVSIADTMTPAEAASLAAELLAAAMAARNTVRTQ